MIARPSASLALLLTALFFLLAAPATAAGKRVALVVGNSAYVHSAVLDNPANDARQIATALEQHGFETIKGIDLDHAGMLATIRDFSRKLQGAEVAVFFYAGHGIQVSNRNYLVPVDAKLADSFGIDFELVRLERIHRMMEEQAKINLIFLDACRNNPLSRNLARSMGTRSASIGDGLAPMESGVGSLISFSTQPGNVALDGRGQSNSPYAAALAGHIGEGKGDITEILIKVRRDVMVATAQQQIPWEHSALTQQFYFEKPAAPPPGQTSARPQPDLSRQEEIVFWESVKDSDDKDLIKAYLDRYPNGAFVSLARVLIARFDGASPSPPAVPVPENSKATAEPIVAMRQPVGDAETSVRGASPPPPARLEPDVRKAAQAAEAEQRAAEAEQRAELFRLIQTRLKDVGCYRGAIDGDWGPGSRGALRAAFGGSVDEDYQDMSDLDAAKADAILAALPDDAGRNCAAPVTTAKPRRERPQSTAPRRRSSGNARRQQTTSREPTRRRPAKRCRARLNPESFTDEKAPIMIEVCD